MRTGNIHGCDGVKGATRSLLPSETGNVLRSYGTVGEDRVAIDIREWLPACARSTVPGSAAVEQTQTSLFVTVARGNVTSRSVKNLGSVTFICVICPAFVSNGRVPWKSSRL